MATASAAAGDGNLASPFHALATLETVGPACLAGLVDPKRGCGTGGGGPFAVETDPAAWMRLVLDGAQEDEGAEEVLLPCAC